VRSKREKRKEVILLSFVNIDMRLNLNLMMNNVCILTLDEGGDRDEAEE
jgi:citrate lyase alpha subunit